MVKKLLHSKLQIRKLNIASNGIIVHDNTVDTHALLVSTDCHHYEIYGETKNISKCLSIMGKTDTSPLESKEFISYLTSLQQNDGSDANGMLKLLTMPVYIVAVMVVVLILIWLGLTRSICLHY